jgi:hypothetical protein
MEIGSNFIFFSERGWHGNWQQLSFSLSELPNEV